MNRTETIRTIGFWAVVFMLIIFSYQLGQWNAINIHKEIVSYCGNIVNSSVGIFGDLTLWKNNVTSLMP